MRMDHQGYGISSPQTPYSRVQTPFGMFYPMLLIPWQGKEWRLPFLSLFLSYGRPEMAWFSEIAASQTKDQLD